MTCFTVKKVYTWKMRNGDPDSKYFGEILENEVFTAKTYKNHPKPGKRFTVWFPKELINREHLKNTPLSGNYS